MAIERTYVMLKPGVMQRRIAGEILSRIEKKGLKPIAMKLMNIDRKLAETHYAEHVGKSFFAELTAYITSGPVLAMVIEGDNAIATVRRLCGATKVEDALPGTIRGDFAMHTGMNIIHASDAPASAEREIGLYFKPEEIVSWKDGNEGWI
ncbi:MAG TPA: nucleoside-diphosphate kinase [Rectinemataceae bacterium]|nr:nucleoside-diphosphate kinase [Rectinemataceae bacterium]